MVDSKWISTGKAAAMMGYSSDHFRRKFDGVIRSRKASDGYRKWLKEEVERLARDMESSESTKK